MGCQECQPEVDPFSQFVKRIVPTFTRQTANTRWTYDVNEEEKQMSIFRLQYKDNMVTVADCLGLRFFSNPADPPLDLFLPSYSSGEHKAEPAFFQGMLGKSILTTPEDIQTILNHLDGGMGSSMEELLCFP
ncbi:hypothetical protein RvY_02747-1 [Ramazzottius varieornatus]|uniref:Uncharacterized protein n=1 Tax=Ramazzottius varieornatus TaxID=947166 RepID=A0A1D1UVC1_RAMVA|nr:hypothetical protein RvY_02747-1 [Ramazzottius varieornatus]